MAPPVKYNARDCVFQISDGAATPVWTEIGGLNTFTLSRSENEETTDTTSFVSAGEYEGQVMQRGASLQLEGFRLTDPATGQPEPGQKLVEALGTKVGNLSLGQVRFAAPGETIWEVWTAYVSVGDTGGGNNDKASWSCTFTRSGPKTTMARP